MHALPAVLPLRIGEETVHDFGIQIALTAEIRIETAVRKSRARHDLSDGHALKTMAVEKLSCAVDDSLFRL